MGAGKKKKSRWAGIWTALLGALCALVLSVVFYGTMVYQLADDTQTSVQRTPVSYTHLTLPTTSRV